jgi:hypothetical protein
LDSIWDLGFLFWFFLGKAPEGVFFFANSGLQTKITQFFRAVVIGLNQSLASDGQSLEQTAGIHMSMGLFNYLRRFACAYVLYYFYELLYIRKARRSSFLISVNCVNQTPECPPGFHNNWKENKDHIHRSAHPGS